MKKVSHHKDITPGILGTLDSLHAVALPHADEVQIFDGAVIVNGVALPQQVAEELRRLGIALSWYNHGELRDAVEACAADGQLVDDPGGHNFRDKLKVTMDEELDESSAELVQSSNKRKKTKNKGWFCTNLKQERNANKARHFNEDACGITSWFM